MKNLTDILNEEKAKTELEKFIIWNVVNRHNSKVLFIGTESECNKEFEEMEYSSPNEEIHKNQVIDQWENDVEAVGYITFASGEILTYNI